jgi:hypothetical protein
MHNLASDHVMALLASVWKCSLWPRPNANVVMGCKRKNVIFWDCKLYGDQRATVMDILSENCKTEYPKSVTELLKVEGNRFVQSDS